MRIIFHLDLDSYFVSVHKILDKTLENKPVVISFGKRRSIITSASYEAKAHKIRVPMPFYKAKQLCPNLISINPNFKLYDNYSKKLFDFIKKKFTKKIQISSIDECYIDVTDIWKPYKSPVILAKKMQFEIMKNIKLPCSIGIADNKFVAKMSTQINKPFGITVTPPGQFLKRFGNWSLEKFHGIGKPTALKLNQAQIFTINDLANCPLEKAYKCVGKVALKLISQANGNDSDFIDFLPHDLKSISKAITFQDFDKNDRQQIFIVIKKLIREVCKKAKNHSLVGDVLSIGIKDKGGLEVKLKSLQKKLAIPINNFKEILSAILPLFNELWNEQPIKYLSVTLSGLKNKFKTTYQSSLFDTVKNKSKIEKIIDKVNCKFKNQTIKTGKEFIDDLRLNEDTSFDIDWDFKN